MKEGPPGFKAFVADRMLGKLARYLRLMGYDVLYPPPMPDQRLAAVAQREGRLLLTRDRELVDRQRKLGSNPPVVEIKSERADLQLRQLVEEGLVEGCSRPRCGDCNSELRKLPRDVARHLVHPYTAAVTEAFYFCPRCNIIFWDGSHWRRFRKIVLEAVEGGRLTTGNSF
jgi:hypothetical protein